MNTYIRNFCIQVRVVFWYYHLCQTLQDIFRGHEFSDILLKLPYEGFCVIIRIKKFRNLLAPFDYLDSRNLFFQFSSNSGQRSSCSSTNNNHIKLTRLSQGLLSGSLLTSWTRLCPTCTTFCVGVWGILTCSNFCHLILFCKKIKQKNNYVKYEPQSRESIHHSCSWKAQEW